MNRTPSGCRPPSLFSLPTASIRCCLRRRLLLFVYYLLTSAAAWLALYDLILRPYHWHKTEHGLAKTSRQAMLSIAARAAAAKASLL
jgi:hypothetical protein